MDFPKMTSSQLKGRMGEEFFSDFVVRKLGCIYHKTHNENDFGIDGEIELVKDGKVTGKRVGVQIKCGKSYFNYKTDWGYRYVGENSQLNYFLNNQKPIFIVIMNEEFNKCHWVQFGLEKTVEIGEKHWGIEIPEYNELSTNFKQEIFRSVGDIIDFEEEMQKSRLINELLPLVDMKRLAISKEEIVNNRYNFINEYFNRMCMNRELLIKSRNSVYIYFPEYDKDPREIREIPEIMRWLRNSIDNGIPWFYFLDYRYSSSLMLLADSYCHVSTDIIKIGNMLYYNYDKWELMIFLEKNFDNLREFFAKYNIEREIYCEIERKINELFRV